MSKNNDEKLPELFTTADRLYKKKCQDYDQDGLTIDDYMIFGHKSYIHMINQKAMRLRSINSVGEAGVKVNFDSLLDTLIDLVNYSAAYADAIKNKRV